MERILLNLKSTILCCVLMFANTNIFAQDNTTTYEDVLTADLFPATTTTYTIFSDVTASSAAIYAGCTAKQPATTAIQLNNSKPAVGNIGIISTESGGNITQIKIAWANTTTKDRILSIYGKNSEYTSASDLFDSKSKQGTLLGDVTYNGTTDEIDIITSTESFKYIGIRAKDGALYLNSITITYESESTTEPNPDPDPEPEKLTQTITFPTTEYSIEWNDITSFSSPTVEGAVGTVTYTSSNPEIATVNAQTGEVEILAQGVVTITANAAETDTHLAGEASYTITIYKEPTIDISGSVALVGEKDGVYYAMSSTPYNTTALSAESVIVINNGVIKTANNTETIHWNIEADANNPNQYIISTASEPTKYLTGKSGATDLSLKDSKFTWTKDTENNSWGTDGYTLLYRTKFNYFKNFKSTNAGTADYTGYTVAMPFVDGYTRTITQDNIGTICLPYAVKASEIQGIEIYTIAGKKVDAEGNPTSLVCQKFEEDLQAGVPYIFLGNSTLLAARYSEEAVDVPQTDNGLVGAFEQIEVERGKYLISQNRILKCGVGCSIPANRAYIDMDNVSIYTENPSEAKRMLFIGKDGTVGLQEVSNTRSNAIVDVYTISGMLIRKGIRESEALQGLQRGLYIVGGKKVVVE